MKIDKAKLNIGIWCEDDDGNRIKHNPDMAEFPSEATTVHISWPLEVREEVYKLNDYVGKDGVTRKYYKGSDRLMTFTSFIGSGNEDVIMAMVNSGDYTLSEALAVWANACERCMNVLAYKYLNGTDGYEEYSEEWKRCPTECDFCKGETE